MSKSERIDLAALRGRLDGLTGPRYWRGLEELADTEEFRRALASEFPEAASEPDPVGRRHFLKLMGASLAMAGFACTRQPAEIIVPFVEQPEDLIPGRALYYATAMPLAGYGTGVLAEAHVGRPTKIEGNPQHPASLGASSVFVQASVLGLYDPDRAQTIQHLGEIRPWGDALDVLRETVETQKEIGGGGLRLLSGTVTSPTEAALIEELRAVLPQMRWHQWEPVGGDAARLGALQAFGEPVATHYRLEEADVILSLDADFLGSGPAHLRYVREFSRRRNVDAAGADPCRLYVMETAPTVTGSKADHRLAAGPGRIEELSAVAASLLGARAGGGDGGEQAAWIAAAVADLEAHRGRSAVIPGDGQPAWVHALAHAMNQKLGNVGRTVIHTDPVEAEPVDHAASITDSVRDMRAGDVSVLVNLGGDPVYNAPADLDFAGAMEQVALRFHLADQNDGTAARCQWVIPRAHYLESWGDVRAFDGTVSLIQPLIEPLYDSKTDSELLAALLGRAGAKAHDLVREHWSGRMGGDFEGAWARALHDGVVPGTALPARRLRMRDGWDRGAAPAGAGEDLELVFRADPTVHDGRFVNNGWLQELSKPITKLTWDNAALISPATAERLGVTSQDVLELQVGERSLQAPAWVLPGHADGAVTVHLGYGRPRAGRVAEGTGFDAYSLRTVDSLSTAHGLRVSATGERRKLACTQTHHSMEGRELVRSETLEHFRRHPDFAQHVAHEPGPDMTLYPSDHRYEGHAWGLAIDLNACIGCGACEIACQAENNIPVVGKEEVSRGREMSWIRVDRYFEGDLDNPEIHHQPVPCMHCENAPCELVCPVGATVHSSEGLNDMVYNRCVGTRYCANNCPYKVRRFNFFDNQSDKPPTLKMLSNPDVTVRSRGVMEKCTYCVQRINLARIEARKQDRDIRDGEITTACEQACPAQAITFGDINDAGSRVARLKAGPRNYGILTELNTRPRTTYLASVRNPSAALADGGHHDDGTEES